MLLADCAWLSSCLEPTNVECMTLWGVLPWKKLDKLGKKTEKFQELVRWSHILETASRNQDQSSFDVGRKGLGISTRSWASRCFVCVYSYLHP